MVFSLSKIRPQEDRIRRPGLVQVGRKVAEGVGVHVDRHAPVLAFRIRLEQGNVLHVGRNAGPVLEARAVDGKNPAAFRQRLLHAGEREEDVEAVAGVVDHDVVVEDAGIVLLDGRHHLETGLLLEERPVARRRRRAGGAEADHAWLVVRLGLARQPLENGGCADDDAARGQRALDEAPAREMVVEMLAVFHRALPIRPSVPDDAGWAARWPGVGASTPWPSHAMTVHRFVACAAQGRGRRRCAPERDRRGAWQLSHDSRESGTAPSRWRWPGLRSLSLGEISELVSRSRSFDPVAPLHVMAGLVPAIHEFFAQRGKERGCPVQTRRHDASARFSASAGCAVIVAAHGRKGSTDAECRPSPDWSQCACRTPTIAAFSALRTGSPRRPDRPGQSSPA